MISELLSSQFDVTSFTWSLAAGVTEKLDAIGLLSGANEDDGTSDVFVKTPDLEGSQKGLGAKKRLRVIDD